MEELHMLHRILLGCVVVAVVVAAVAADRTSRDDVMKAIKGDASYGKVPASARPLIDELGSSVCGNAEIVKAVVEQNRKGLKPDDVKRIDQEWQAAEQMLPIQKEILGNACAQNLKRILEGHQEIVETFVMDNQGALVGANNLTSDYWQGDEEKWQNSFKAGKGGIDVGAQKFDRSANAMLQQISLPIVDDAGTVVGAVTFGVDVKRLTQQYDGADASRSAAGKP
jgi:hypothetical protein